MKLQRRLIPIAVIALLALVILLIATRGGKSDGALLFTGTVEATDARLGFETPGRIAEIVVHEGDAVISGQSLAVLDTTQAHARKTQLEAQAAAARAILAELVAGPQKEEVAAAHAASTAADERLDQVTGDRNRIETLFQGGAVSQEARDHAESAVRIAKSQAEQAYRQFQLVEKGPRSERIEAQKAEVARAEAAVGTQVAALDNMIVRSPFDALVTVRHREPGETVAPGLPVLTVANMSDRWVRIYVPEQRIGRVHIGQEAKLSTDSFPDRDLDGRVVWIASEAEFTPKNVQTAEERVKLVYRVKVQIIGDESIDLKPGMPVDVVLVEAGP